MELRHEKPCALRVLTFPYGSQTFFFPQRTILFLTEVAFYFSQKNTEEQNTQHSTETLSQPISQNLTAIFSWNVLWYLYAGGVLWDRNVGWKGSVRSVSSVREKDLYEECKQSSRGNLTYYLLIWNKSAGWRKILTTHQADHPQNTQLSSPTTEDITHKKSACYVLHSNICPSCS